MAAATAGITARLKGCSKRPCLPKVNHSHRKCNLAISLSMFFINPIKSLTRCEQSTQIHDCDRESKLVGVDLAKNYLQIAVTTKKGKVLRNSRIDNNPTHITRFSKNINIREKPMNYVTLVLRKQEQELSKILII